MVGVRITANGLIKMIETKFQWISFWEYSSLSFYPKTGSITFWAFSFRTPLYLGALDSGKHVGDFPKNCHGWTNASVASKFTGYNASFWIAHPRSNRTTSPWKSQVFFLYDQFLHPFKLGWSYSIVSDFLQNARGFILDPTEFLTHVWDNTIIKSGKPTFFLRPRQTMWTFDGKTQVTFPSETELLTVL